MASNKKIEERLSKLESAVEFILQRLETVEKKLEPIDNLRKRVDDADSKHSCVSNRRQDQRLLRN